jgi:hypothetical protein
MANCNFVNANRPTPENYSYTPEKRLWRAVLNQAIEEGLGLYNSYMCDYEKLAAQRFINHRSKHFDDVCEMAEMDADSTWKGIQKFKLMKKGIINANNKREIQALELVAKIEQSRNHGSWIRKKSNRMESRQSNRGIA